MIDNDEARIQLWEHDNCSGDSKVFWKNPGTNRDFAGDYKDLDDREIEFNDKARSATLFGAPGTTVWLFDKKGFGTNDDILELKVPDGASSVIVNNLDTLVTGTRWINDDNGLAGKVSGVKWT